MQTSRLWLACSVGVAALIVSATAHAGTLSAAPNPRDFGDVLVGAPAATSTVTITNTGSDTVITGFSENAGANCGQFTETATGLPATLANNGTLVVDVTFAPNGRGARTCTVTLVDDNGTADTFVLNGNGVAPVMATSPTTVSFGGVPVTGSAPMQTFGVTNNGDLDLTITLTKAGTGAADYTFTTSIPVANPIPPGMTNTVTVTFDPSAEGARDATITVDGNDPLNAQDVVTLSGTGQVRRIVTSPDPLTFASVIAGSSASSNIRVDNTGQIALSLQSGSISGSSWITFTNAPQLGCLGSQSCDFSPDISIAGGGFRNVGIQCAPPLGSSGTQNATVTFTSNSDGVGADNSVTVNCTADKPNISVSPLSFDFGDVPVIGPNGTTTITVMNTGTATLTYDITTTGANPGDFTYGGTQCIAVSSPCTLAGGAMRVFTVTFNPPADGARSATMNFNSNDQDPGDATIPVDLVGNGTGAEITRLTGAPIDFGQVQVGTAVTRQLTFRNDGNTDLSITALSVPNAVFTFTPVIPPTQTLTPGQSRIFDVTCTPTARQTYSGNMTATNNSWNNTSLSTAVTCQGVSADLKINTLDIATQNFGGVPEGSAPVVATLVLRNYGERDALNIAASLDLTTVGYTFAGIPTTLAAGTQTNFTVTFTPTSTMQGGPAVLSVNADPQGALNPPLEDARLNIDGNSQSNGIDIDTPTLSFPDTRWDQTSSLDFTISNTGQSSFNVTQLMNSNTVDYGITNIAIDQAGDGTFETNQGSFVQFLLCGSGDTAASCPGANGGRARVTVQFHPNDTTLGNLTGLIAIVCSLPSDNMRMVTLTGNSVSPALTLDPGMIVDFGAVDVDAGGAVLTLRLRNTATSGTMNVTGHTAYSGPFTDSGFAPGAVPPGASNDTVINYTPAAEGNDEITVTYNVTGLFMQPSAVMVTIRGHGTDRHLSTTGDIVFPPTYRNPGASAPQQDVTVTNTGEATLNLSAVMLTSNPPFTIVSGDPVMVPGAGQATFRVQFAPTMAGQFDGVLEITHNDNGLPGFPTANVNVSGMGIDREMFYMPTREIGTAIVGEDIHFDDVIELVNQSDTTSHPTTFTVHELRVLDPSGVFAVDAPADRQVAAGETTRFGVDFAPTAAGPFSTVVEVYLDGDPQAHGVMTLTGHAVEVEVKGGGCSASGGGQAGTLVVILLALAVGVRRRRRAAAAIGAGGLALALVLVHAPASRADVAVQSFHPLPSIEDDLFAVESATVGQAKAWAAGLAFTYAMDPLVSTVTSCGTECPPDGSVMVGDTASLVKQQTVIALGGAYAIANRFEVGLTIPLINQSGDAAMLGAAADGGTLGDIAAHGKIQLLKLGRIALGAAAVITVPTAKDGQYAGFSGPSGQVELLVSRRSRRVLVSLNGGFLARKTEDFASVSQGSAMTFGVGAGYRLLPSLWLAGELFGDMGVVARSQPTLQALAGLRYRLGSSITLGLGGGGGLVDGVGAPKARGFVLVSYSPAMRPQEAIRPPPPPPDTRDGDGDGIVNVKDKCPNEAEDIDLYEDQDGCPDYDNDGDNVADAADNCDGEAEDIDGYQDGDGCPDEDNDGDGIPDKTDVCPNDLEDKDGHSDLDGCPDDDNDHDGVKDQNDKCPNQAETINGNNDDDGCADRGDSLVLLAADRIELLEPVKFVGTTAKLGKGTTNILGQVGATLRANPEILRISVRAHVHPRWTREKDQTLSDERAKAIKDWLVQWGIKAERIDVRGFGSDKPLVKKDAPKAELINDRIEFVIMEKSQ